jgi:hypothetical protein
MLKRPGVAMFGVLGWILLGLIVGAFATIAIELGVAGVLLGSLLNY